MNFCQPASLAKATFLGLLATGTLGLGAIQAACAANVTCAAIDATSIARFRHSTSVLTALWSYQSRRYIGDQLHRGINITDTYTLDVVNINDTLANIQAFKNVQFLASGAIGAQTFTNQANTIWPTKTPSTPPVVLIDPKG